MEPTFFEALEIRGNALDIKLAMPHGATHYQSQLGLPKGWLSWLQSMFKGTWTDLEPEESPSPLEVIN